MTREEVDSLTIKVAGKADDYITADSFLDVVRETVAILRDLDPSNHLVWRLKAASINSPLVMTFVAAPRPDAEEWPTNVSQSYLDMFRRLDRGAEPLPDTPPKAMFRAKKLIDVLNDGVAQITFSSPRADPVTPTQRVQATVAEFERNRRDVYRDYTTLEGELNTVSVDGGSKFFIRDRVTGHRTQCVIPHDKLDAAKKFLERRVWVTGSVRYKAGRPMLMEVESFDAMPDRDSLPQFADIKGIDVTGGVDSVEFVRRGRNADSD